MRRRTAWLTLALFCAVALLVFAGLRGTRQEASWSASESARLTLQALAWSRQAHLQLCSQPRPSTPQAALRAVEELRRAAELNPTRAALRRLAVMQAYVGDSAWQQTVIRLRTALDTGTSFQADAEIALWNRVLGRGSSRRWLEQDITSLQQMGLGWYEHVAAELAYRNAGDFAGEERARDRALRSTAVLGAVSAAAVLLGLCGLGLLAVGIGYVRVYLRKHDPLDLPGFLRPTTPPVLSPAKADLLYLVFIVFLLSLVAARFAQDVLPAALLGKDIRQLGTGHRLAYSFAMLGIMLLPATALLVAGGRRVGLRAWEIGLYRAGFWKEATFGALCWVAALPVLAASLYISSQLFRGVETPINPAVTQFASAGTLWLQLLLFVQVAVAGPLIEEVSFRGIFFRSLWGRLGAGRAMAIASAVFALLHPQLPLGFLSLFLLGLLFNALYWLRGSLVPSVVAHGLNNASIFVFVTLTVGG
jgi:membrane protease YdiL (CAAX protease family)